ncbi:uncharacterized protein LOC117181418 [Belonocnema kinseyi]|uniref:uncharacterized protein LOC117181418 n=1 Tax=Belonocnema kinseyi TaxID=2817044 RepID=UPI00143D081D|nr:uncharacterized protein LOC117181418 [Belonocnema kinseyi]
MDNNGLMQVETIEIHETRNSMNFIPEKSEEVPTHEENGHVTIEACELPSIDVMLESSLQNEQENNATIIYENTKQQYEPESAEKVVTECENSEFPVDQNQAQLENVSSEVEENPVLDGHQETQVVEMQENQVMEVDEGQVMIETGETLSFETTNESIREQENTNVRHEEVLQECVLEGENGDLNPEEYTTDEVENASQFEAVIQDEAVAEYVSEDYHQKEDSLPQNSDAPIETNEFAHLTNATEIQLSNEEMIHDDPQQVSFAVTPEEGYQAVAVENTEEPEIVEEESRQITYRQQNIINMAAASANIDMQDDTDIDIEQDEAKLIQAEVGASVEGVNIILNSAESVEEATSVLQKEQEEGTSEVIEEIYFIQDVSGDNLEEDKVVSEVQTVLISQSGNLETGAIAAEADLSVISQNSGISEKSRNVIQDIFDDWGDENVDENVEDDNEVSFRDQDSVEIELNNLLNEKKKSPVKEVQSTSKGLVNNLEIVKPADKSSQILEPESAKKTVKNSSKDIPSCVQPYLRGEDLPGGTNSKRKMPSPRLGVKVPSRLLKSQIASPAEVSEVLKERIREQQKDFEKPQVADIVFVKKLTQRFASKICPGGAMSVPGLLPLSRSEISKQTENTDNRELLAILEGDVDPDWSNLKSQSSADDAPETDGDISLSVEIPKIANKRGRKKSINIVADIEKTPKRDMKKETAKVKDVAKSESVKAKKIVENDTPRKPLKEKDSQNTTPVTTPQAEIRIDETRSGRKRKPTEKALEQYASKRQKIFKTKTPGKKDLLSEKVADKTSSSLENRDEGKSLPETPETSTLKETPSKQITADKSASLKKEKILEKKKSPVKETPPAATPKKVPAKKLITQKALSLKKSSISLQSKLSSPVRPVGRPPKVLTESAAKAQGRPKKTEAATKPKKKGSSKEIDRLLQDEGVVNLLYDVGQPRTRRLIPITQTQKKVMDIEKAERDLDLRKKLVKSAVLRLRGSNSETDKVAPRSKRTPLVNTEVDNSSHKSSASAMTSPTEFIYPAKIRNAADASVIVRRHSSSSFSSVSGSPRVSIDGPIDGFRVDDDHHGLRSTKRKHSIDKEAKHLDMKRVKRALQNSDSSVAGKSKSAERLADIPEDRVLAKRQSGKATVESKKIDKTPRHSDVSVGSSSVDSEKSVKVTTRSNGATVKKVVGKNKKAGVGGAAGGKDKKSSSSAISSGSASVEEASKSQDELSACLAEAANALSAVSGLPRRGSATATGRKTKGSANVDSSNAKSESKLFSNKEINVRRNGNLVQLTLNPSSSKIVNGITLAVMQELRDILSVLKKDDECRVVLLTSTGTSFCEGLDLSTLLQSDKEKRKRNAEEMANAVKDFIKCLATFTKPLVAGVQGAAVGLGVTILPLFDLVIASDKATFYTPYGKLGQIPEGAAIMTLSHVHGSAVASELLLGGRTLTASEALRAGLVTRVLWPDRFPLELVPIVKAMSEQSSQSMKATKALLRQSLRNKLNAALESETHILVQHWCSAECQEAIKAYVARKVE